MIIVSCVGCSKKYTLADTTAGKKVRCKQCAAVIVVPQSIATPVEQKRASAQPAIPQRNTSSRPANVKPVQPPLVPLKSAQESEPEPDGFSELDMAGVPIDLAPEAIPVISYATPEGNQATDLEPYSSFKHRLKSRELAIKAYARVRSLAFARNHISADCGICHRPNVSGKVYEYNWRAGYGGGSSIHWLSVITIFYGGIVYSTKLSEFVPCRTYHRLCYTCRNRQWIRTSSWVPCLLLAIPIAITGLILWDSGIAEMPPFKPGLFGIARIPKSSEWFCGQTKVYAAWVMLALAFLCAFVVPWFTHKIFFTAVEPPFSLFKINRLDHELDGVSHRGR